MTREEAILCLKGIKNYGRDTFTEQSDWQNSLDMAIKALEQEPKTGHWTYICNSSVNGLKIVECSDCGTRTYGSGSFCPNCGAKMIKPQESEEV